MSSSRLKTGPDDAARVAEAEAGQSTAPESVPVTDGALKSRGSAVREGVARSIASPEIPREQDVELGARLAAEAERQRKDSSRLSFIRLPSRYDRDGGVEL